MIRSRPLTTPNAAWQTTTIEQALADTSLGVMWTAAVQAIAAGVVAVNVEIVSLGWMRLERV